MIFRNVEAKISIRKKTFFLKRNFLRHISCLKSTKMHFYGNPTTDFFGRVPFIATGYLPKIRKIVTCYNGRHHIYVDTCFSSFKLKMPEDSWLLLEELLCFGFARYENTHMDYEKRKDSEVGHVINRQQWRWAVPDHTVFFFKQLFSPRVVLSSLFRHLRMTV